MATILRPIYGKTESNVRDTSHVCGMLHHLSQEEDESIVSYDVVNMFGSVPTHEAAALAISRLEKDTGLQERTGFSLMSCKQLLQLCVASNYFKCKEKYYRTSTCPIGSPLSSGLCSIFMEEFEDKVLRSAPVSVRCWRRYVDDSLAVVKKGSEDILLAHLNQGHEDIKFTYEKETAGKISYLDIEIKREGKGVRTKVFRKATATDRYLDYRSAHCKQVKLGIISCLKKRAEVVCVNTEDVRDEMENLRRTFVKNGYPEREVRRKLNSTNQHRSDDKIQEKPALRIPYVPGISGEFERLTRRLGIRIRYVKGRSVGDLVSRPKVDKEDVLERGGVIYKQKCGGCEKVYVGETGRKAQIRKKEHERDVREMKMTSAISEHCHSMNHQPDFGSFQVIDTEKEWKRRRIKESLYIMVNNTFNRDNGYNIDRRWKTLFCDSV